LPSSGGGDAPDGTKYAVTMGERGHSRQKCKKKKEKVSKREKRQKREKILLAIERWKVYNLSDYGAVCLLRSSKR
jgi:hypothetical protein